MIITKLDIQLLARVRLLLLADAEALERSETPWTAANTSKSAKRTHDRILREARDLAALRRRLQEQVSAESGKLAPPAEQEGLS